MPGDLTLAMALGLLLHAADHLLAAAYEWVQRQVHTYGRRRGERGEPAAPVGDAGDCGLRLAQWPPVRPNW